MGVCHDTCNVWDAGYDHRERTWRRSHGFAGWSAVKARAIHLNNSLNARGSRKDRHARITEGTLSLEAIGRIVRHSALEGLPFILETPNDEAGYAAEIALLKNLHDNS
jgi:deoxyribonuclease-4